MNIKEQLEEAVNESSWLNNEYLGNCKFEDSFLECNTRIAAEKCVEVAEDVAIRFADWLMTSQHDIIYEPKATTKELFEVFKKENNL